MVCVQTPAATNGLVKEILKLIVFDPIPTDDKGLDIDRHLFGEMEETPH